MEIIHRLPVLHQPQPKKKSRLSYSVNFKLAAVRHAESNGNRATARYLGINEKQIRDWRSKKAGLLTTNLNAKRLKGAGRQISRFNTAAAERRQNSAADKTVNVAHKMLNDAGNKTLNINTQRYWTEQQKSTTTLKMTADRPHVGDFQQKLFVSKPTFTSKTTAVSWLRRCEEIPRNNIRRHEEINGRNNNNNAFEMNKNYLSTGTKQINYTKILPKNHAKPPQQQQQQRVGKENQHLLEKQHLKDTLADQKDFREKVSCALALLELKSAGTPKTSPV